MGGILKSFKGPVILVHNRTDKDFGLELLEDLCTSGYSAWIQVPDARGAFRLPYRVGGPWLHRRRDPIPTGFRCAVVVSGHSIDSWWLKRLADLTAHPSSVGPEQSVIFLLTEDIIMPEHLKGRIVVDFRRNRLYGKSFKRLLKLMDEASSRMWGRREGDRLLSKMSFEDVFARQRRRHTN